MNISSSAFKIFCDVMFHIRTWLTRQEPRSVVETIPGTACAPTQIYPWPDAKIVCFHASRQTAGINITGKQARIKLLSQYFSLLRQPLSHSFISLPWSSVCHLLAVKTLIDFQGYGRTIYICFLNWMYLTFKRH